MRLAPALRVKFTDTERGVIAGYGSTFGGVPDAYGDVVAPGAFARTLAEHEAAGTMPLLLWQHRSDEPIGRWTRAREDDRGLYLEGQLNLSTTRGKDAHAHLIAGDIGALSIGFFIAEGGQTRKSDGTSLLTDLDLAEVSVVSFPANRNARIQHAKNLQSKSELVDLLREGGLGRFLVGAFNSGGAQIFDRMDVEVLVSTENADDFERNLVSVRIEERLAFATYRPDSFVTGQLPGAA